jgi:chromosome segregation ATPase
MTPPDGVLRVRAFTDPAHSFGIAVHIDHRTEDGKRAVGEVVFREVAAGLRGEAAIVLHEEDAQRLAEDLYAAGLRPRAAMGSAGQIEAVQAHLETVKAELVWAKRRLDDVMSAVPDHELSRALARATDSLKEQTDLNVLGHKAVETARSREGMERARADKAERCLASAEDTFERERARFEKVAEEKDAAAQKFFAEIAGERDAAQAQAARLEREMADVRKEGQAYSDRILEANHGLAEQARALAADLEELKRQRDERLRDLANAEKLGAEGLAREAALRDALNAAQAQIDGGVPRSKVAAFIAAALGDG